MIIEVTTPDNEMYEVYISRDVMPSRLEDDLDTGIVMFIRRVEKKW